MAAKLMPRNKKEEMMALNAAHREFLEEAETYAFRFRCQDCAHLHPLRSDCIFGYPTDVLQELSRPVRDKEGQWIFCKFFELA